MDQTPKIKVNLKRKHVPQLPKDSLALALQKLESVPITASAKRALGDILRAAANPNAEKIDVVVGSLDEPRKKLVTKTAKAVREVTQDVTARGRVGLEALSDAEWNALIESD